MKSAINMAWEHGGADFQSRFDKFTAQAEQMKDRRYRFCDYLGPLNDGGQLAWDGSLQSDFVSEFMSDFGTQLFRVLEH